MKRMLIITSKKVGELGHLLESTSAYSSEFLVSFLFIGDGAYSLVKASEDFQTLKEQVPASTELFASKEDIEVRGLSTRISESVQVIDYGEIVELVMNDDTKVVNYA